MRRRGTHLAARPSVLGGCGGCGYGQRMGCIGAVLIDIDGVLTVSWQPLPGAVAALRRLRAAAVPLALVTNTTSRTRASIASALAEARLPGHRERHPDRAGHRRRLPARPLPGRPVPAAQQRGHRRGSGRADPGPPGRPGAGGRGAGRRGRPGVQLPGAQPGLRPSAARGQAGRHAARPVLAYQPRPATGHRRVPRGPGTGGRAPRRTWWASPPRRSSLLPWLTCTPTPGTP